MKCIQKSTYFGISSALQTAPRAHQSCSLVIFTIISTAEKSEFYYLATGLMSWIMQCSSITSHSVVHLELPFQKLVHLANADLDTCLHNGLTSAFEASTVGMVGTAMVLGQLVFHAAIFSQQCSCINKFYTLSFILLSFWLQPSSSSSSSSTTDSGLLFSSVYP